MSARFGEGCFLTAQQKRRIFDSGIGIIVDCLSVKLCSLQSMIFAMSTDYNCSHPTCSHAHKHTQIHTYTVA